MPYTIMISRLRQKFGVGKWRQLKSDEKGATAVEFAIVAAPFFLLLMTIIEVSIFFFAGQVLENAVEQVGRELRTGQLNSANTNLGALRNKIYDKTSGLFDRNSLFISLQIADTFKALPPPPGPTNGVLDDKSFTQREQPKPEKVMRLTVSYQWPVITNYVAAHLSNLNNGKALMTAMAIFKSEPYE